MKLFALSFVYLLLFTTGCSVGNIFEGTQDIGEVKQPGSMVYSEKDATYTIKAAGENIWYDSDAFFMAYKEVSGDFSMRADIAFEGEGVNPHRKMGIMIRESLTPGSPYVDIAVHGDGLTSLQYRERQNDLTKELVATLKLAPTRIYLERKGNLILVKSGHGDLPTAADDSVEIALPDECYVGLFLCSHEADVMEVCHFRNVNFKKL